MFVMSFNESGQFKNVAIIKSENDEYKFIQTN